MKKVILASGSPRRKELMTQAGIPFTVKVSACEEKITKREPEQIVLELSEQKADAVALEKKEAAIFIGADTIVVLDGEIMGKPRDRKDAFDMLYRLQGRTHEVWTGVTILEQDENGTQKREKFAKKTEVEMYPMEEAEIWKYIDTEETMNETNIRKYEWEDKAGGYGIQTVFGARYIKQIYGDYYNVVGLPISSLYQELKRLGMI